MVHQDDDQRYPLADLSQIVDSPMLRVMSGELVDFDTHAGLVAIAEYEHELGLSACRTSWPRW